DLKAKVSRTATLLSMTITRLSRDSFYQLVLCSLIVPFMIASILIFQNLIYEQDAPGNTPAAKYTSPDHADRCPMAADSYSDEQLFDKDYDKIIFSRVFLCICIFCSAATAIAYGFATDRETDLHKHWMATGVTPFEFLLSHVLVQLFVLIVELV